MRKHSEIWLLCNYYDSKLNITRDELARLLNTTPENVDTIKSLKHGATRAIVQEMERIGIDRQEMARFFGISKQAISKHVLSDPREYHSPVISEIFSLENYNV